jgi:hypothetical protein
VCQKCPAWLCAWAAHSSAGHPVAQHDQTVQITLSPQLHLKGARLGKLEQLHLWRSDVSQLCKHTAQGPGCKPSTKDAADMQMQCMAARKLLAAMLQQHAGSRAASYAHRRTSHVVHVVHQPSWHDQCRIVQMHQRAANPCSKPMLHNRCTKKQARCARARNIEETAHLLTAWQTVPCTPSAAEPQHLNTSQVC